MRYLLDTNILVRLVNATDPSQGLTERAIDKLFDDGERLYVAPQSLIEFWNAATRPAAVNGLGMSLDEALVKIALFQSEFELAEELPQLFPILKTIGTAAKVIGKQIHDARLVAICHLHSIPNILTFNGRHFARFAAIGPGLNIVEPAAVITVNPVNPAVTKFPPQP